jgi:hypothetical protein
MKPIDPSRIGLPTAESARANALLASKRTLEEAEAQFLRLKAAREKQLKEQAERESKNH